MENASKALLMAGGILIALLIVGVIVLMFNQLGKNQQSQDDLLKTQQIAKFNNQFEPYNKNKLSLLELKSVYNKIESIKTQNTRDNTSEYDIETNIEDLFNSGKVTIPGTGVEGEGSPDKMDLQMFTNNNRFSKINDAYKNKANVSFRCTEMKYNGVDGRISEMNFDVN